MRIEWVTGAEVDSWGFHIWRSTSGQRSDAVRVTEQMIAATGNAAVGASYAFVDSSVVADIGYHYWLVETELDSNLVEYGPITGILKVGGDDIQATPMLYLPWVTTDVAAEASE